MTFGTCSFGTSNALEFGCTFSFFGGAMVFGTGTIGRCPFGTFAHFRGLADASVHALSAHALFAPARKWSCICGGLATSENLGRL